MDNAVKKYYKVTPLTDDEKTIAIELAGSGKAIQQIHEALGVSSPTFWKQRKQDVDFDRAFIRARHEGLEELADELLIIPDTYEDILRGRLKSENIRWVLSKRKAEVYGDRVDVNLNQTVDIGAALSEARARVRPIRDMTQLPTTQVLELADVSRHSTTGSEPVSPKPPDENGDDDIFS